MRKIKFFIFLLCLVKYLNVNADNKDIKNGFEAKIAVIDLQLILEHSLAIQDIRKSIEKLSQHIQAEFAQKEAELKIIEETLIQKRAIISTEVFESEFNTFNKKVSEEQKNLQNKKERLRQAHVTAIGQVHEVTLNIIKNLSTQYNFNIVLFRSAVFYVDDSLDITQIVLEKLNNQLYTIKIDLF